MNVTRRKDGQWRSLTNDELFNAQRAILAIYTSELADRLQALGYELTRTDEKGNFEIAGITREDIQHFSQRRSEIEAALKAKGVDINEASAQQKEKATLKTRAHKKDVDHEALLIHWRTRAKAVGITFDAIQDRAATATFLFLSVSFGPTNSLADRQQNLLLPICSSARRWCLSTRSWRLLSGMVQGVCLLQRCSALSTSLRRMAI